MNEENVKLYPPKKAFQQVIHTILWINLKPAKKKHENLIN